MPAEAPSRTRALRAGVYLVFLLSGACGLVYEVLWVRQLTLVFGVSTYAVCTVLSAFMAGLALGSWYFGRKAVTTRRVLALYGLLEIGIGLCGLAMPHVFRGLMSGYSWFYGAFEGQPTLFVAVRVLVLGMVLLVPTTLMGGTISVLSKFFTRRDDSLSRDLGMLYALNTFGAVAGTVAAGFVLIPWLGISQTTMLVVAGNLIVGVLAIGLEFLTGRASAGTEPALAAATRITPFVRVVFLVFAVSGFCSLGYQVLWTRSLVFYLHNSTYAFTTMLAIFLLGLSLGSLLLNRRIDRSARPSVYLLGAQLLIAVTTTLALVLYAFFPLFLARALPVFAVNSWGKAIGLQLAQSFVILLPITFLMGLTFPVVTRLTVKNLTQVSRSVGNLYSINTLGCIFGSLVVGFFLLPRLGILSSFVTLITLNLAMAALVTLFSPELKLVGKLAGVVLIAGAWLMQDRVLPPDLFERAFRQGAGMLYYRDGVTDTVMVKTPPDDDSVRVLCFADGRGTAGTNTSASNRFMGHLPLLLHDRPEQVLTICFGVGNTLSAIAANPLVKSVDCVELSPSVIDTAPYFPTNEDVVHNPKVTVHVQDGRNYVLGQDATYDVIQLEPPEIHTDGVVNLYTREFYELCQQRLNQRGILCQWLNVTMMPLEEQRMLVATFQDVFPHTTMWMLTRTLSHILLLGTDHRLQISYARLKHRFADPVLGPDLREKTGVQNPVQLLANFKLTEDGIRRFTGDPVRVTDDRTLVDFSTPRSVDANYGLSNGFSGFKITCTLPGGVDETLDYYADKHRTMMNAVENVFPLIIDFADEAEADRVRAALADELRRWREAMDQEIEQQRNQGEAWVNT